jgi:phosphomannomutase
MGFASCEEFNYEGTESRKGTGPAFRSGAEKGGLKIVFYDENGSPAAFIWMRGSGTEPVFRVLADCRGSSPQIENDLLEWHKELIREADSLACRNGSRGED